MRTFLFAAFAAINVLMTMPAIADAATPKVPATTIEQGSYYNFG